MNKRALHHWWKHTRKLQWILLAVFIISATTAVAALRHNNLRMIQLRDAVYTADKGNGDIEGTLRDLRTYIYSHMNTSPSTGANGIKPPIQLKYQYERLSTAEKSRATDVYGDAQKFCEQQNPTGFSGRTRVPCIEQYVSQHGGSSEKAIPDAMYKFDFVSPRWSPDLAGWSLVIAALSGFGFLLCFAFDRFTRAELQKHA